MTNFEWIRPGFEIVKIKLEWNVQVPFLLTENRRKIGKYSENPYGESVRSPLFSPPETPNSKWRLAVYNDYAEIKIHLWHCDSAGKEDNIDAPVMVKMSILNGKRQKVFQQMRVTYSHYMKLNLSKEEIVKSGCQQVNGSLTFCCKIFSHKKNVPGSPADPSLAVDCSGGLSDHFEQLFDKIHSSDVTFTIGSREFPAHKLILAARSEYYAAMFNHPTKENLSGKIEIEDIDPEVFHQLLRFIYTGRLSHSTMEKMAADLFIAADKYLLDGLKIQCENYLMRNMSPDYCAVLLIRSNNPINPAENLKKVAEFFWRFPNEVVNTQVWKTMKKKNPILLCEIQEFVYRHK